MVTYEPQVGVLGSLLLSPELVGQVMAQVRPEEFVSPTYRAVYQAITGQFLAGKPVDLILIRDKLSGMGQVDQLILQIMDLTPTAANVWDYVADLKQEAALHRLRDIGRQLELVTVLEDAQGLVDQANAVFSARPGAVRLSAQQLVEDFMARHGEGRRPDYITWSLPKLDDNMYTEPGDMILLGGYPSAGKTALALRFAWHMAKRRRVGFYSLETNAAKLGDRSISSIAGIKMDAIKRSALTDQDWTRLSDHAESMSSCQLDLIPAGGMTAQDIRADALAHRYEVIFLDYVQLIRSQQRGNRTEIVTSISIELHQMAQAHSIAVVALSQLRRPDTKANGDESAPTMSSLRESGQLEQDADAVLLLYLEEPRKTDSRRVLFVAKNKEGSIGRMYLDFDGLTQTFRTSENIKDTPAQQMLWEDLTKQRDANFPFGDK